MGRRCELARETEVGSMDCPCSGKEGVRNIGAENTSGAVASRPSRVSRGENSLHDGEEKQPLHEGADQAEISLLIRRRGTEISLSADSPTPNNRSLPVRSDSDKPSSSDR